MSEDATPDCVSEGVLKGVRPFVRVSESGGLKGCGLAVGMVGLYFLYV